MGINDAINHAFSLLKTGPSQEPIDISHNFLKSQMSDVHIGFQEDPKREIERLRHQGISREEAMAMYQQYLDSLEQGA